MSEYRWMGVDGGIEVFPGGGGGGFAGEFAGAGTELEGVKGGEGGGMSERIEAQKK